MNTSTFDQLNHTRHGLTPGEFLLENVIKPLNLSIKELAETLEIPSNRLYLIINDKRELTTDTAFRLGHYFGTGPELWLYLQLQSNIEKQKDQWADIKRDIPVYTPTSEKTPHAVTV